MSIIGIVGGIGSGKTLIMMFFVYQDILAGRKIYTNMYFRLDNIPKQFRKNIIHLDARKIEELYNQVKTRELNLQNSALVIDELQNYVDSRKSMSKKSIVFSRFVLLSRHAGKGSCIFYFTTQRITQIDVRVRTNTDNIVTPQILERDENDKPTKVLYELLYQAGGRWKSMRNVVEIGDVCDIYDTHEMLDLGDMPEEDE